MGISLRPSRLKRYRDIAALLLRYGGDDAVRRAGLEDALPSGDGRDDGASTAKAESLAADLERLGPTFVKLGQVLSTRHDLLPPEYTKALARLQDRVGAVPDGAGRGGGPRTARAAAVQGLRRLRPKAHRLSVARPGQPLIVGAALLMRVQTSFTVLGYPGIAMVFFTMAAIGGFGLVIAILRDQ